MLVRALAGTLACWGAGWPSRAPAVRSAEAPADPSLVPLQVFGMSTSEAGFVALLSDAEENVLPVAVNVLDTEEAASPEALTLLQLMQGVDMGGSTLEPERLHRRLLASGSAVECPPSAVRLAGLVVEAVAPPAFTLRVAHGEGTALLPCASAFEAVALAMRYRALPGGEGCTIEAPAALVAAAGLSAARAGERFPAAFTWRDAREQDSRIRRDFAQKVSEATGRPVEPSTSTAPSVTNANTVVPRALLEKALAIAREKGDLAAELRLLQALSEPE